MAVWCDRCRRATGMKDVTKRILTNAGLEGFEGVCPKCDSKIFAIPRLREGYRSQPKLFTEADLARPRWDLDTSEDRLSDKEGCYEDGSIPYYSAIGRVLDTGYGEGEEFDEDRENGYCTGQWIDVEIIYGLVNIDNRSYCRSDVISGIWSYGGDTVIVGKPQRGDIIGYYEGFYSHVWEKINTRS